MIKHSITNMRISGLLLSLSTLVIFSTISSSSSTLIPFRKNISTLDFGRIIESNPLAILNPESPKEIAQLIQSIFSNETLMINMTVAQRGAAHSTYGQSQTSTSNGIIVNMTQLPSFIHIEESFADVAGGVLWVDLLAESLKKGRSPRSWTDYLYLSVGGTLSVAGISGQTFKHGPQISNVIELDVITGRGEQFTCSEKMNADLFYGVLGGLGQFGIITRARIILHSAPKMVKWVKVKYESFDQFIKDQEFLISQGVVDYLEGEIILQHKNLSKVSPRGLNVSYSIEFVIHYDEEIVAQKKLDEILDELKKGGTMAPLPKIEDASYFDFLNRVRKEEMELRKEGLWEVAHPWLNVFVPRAHIKRFKDLLVETIADTYTAGPLIIYPILRHKWNSNMSVVLPQNDNAHEDIIYVVSALQSARPSCTRETACLNDMLQRNEKIIDVATSDPDFHRHGRIRGLGAKQYMPHLNDEMKWKAHFGKKWESFKDLKSRFDPLHILAPGQRIFQRI